MNRLDIVYALDDDLKSGQNALNWPENWPEMWQKVANFVPNGRIIKRHFFGRF